MNNEKTVSFLLLIVQLCPHFAHGGPRTNVIVTGTTLGPNWTRKEGKSKADDKSEVKETYYVQSANDQLCPSRLETPECPVSHPYATPSGLFCCKVYLGINDTSANAECDGRGVELTNSDLCCSGADKISCQEEKCISHREAPQFGKSI